MTSRRNTETGLTAGEEAAYDLEVTELGQRVSDWLTNYQLAALYSGEMDRTWAVILTMIRAVQARTDGAVPAGWMPRFDADGRWAPAWN
jgi:hypothetical protein